MDNIIIGNRLKEARLEKNVTLDMVAKAVGFHKSTIQRYESGKIDNVKLPIVQTIAEYLEVNPAWIVGKSENKYVKNYYSTNNALHSIKISDKQKSLLNKYEKLDPHGKKAVDNLIDNELERMNDQQLINIPAVARRRDYSEPFELNLTKEQIERIQNAPSVTSDDDL